MPMGSTLKIGIDRDHVMVIRLWIEPDGRGTNDWSWRGQVTCGDKRHHFVGLRMLFRQIRKMLDDLSEGECPSETAGDVD